MSDVSMIREPEVERRGRGLRRWSVAWALFDHRTERSYTRRKLFFTERGADRWIESKRVHDGDRWQSRPATPTHRPDRDQTESEAEHG